MQNLDLTLKSSVAGHCVFCWALTASLSNWPRQYKIRLCCFGECKARLAIRTLPFSTREPTSFLSLTESTIFLRTIFIDNRGDYLRIIGNGMGDGEERGLRASVVQGAQKCCISTRSQSYEPLPGSLHRL